MRSILVFTLLAVSLARPAFAKDEFIELTEFAKILTRIETDSTFRELSNLEDAVRGNGDHVHRARLKLLRSVITRRFGFDFSDVAPDQVAKAFALENPVDDVHSSRVYVAGRAAPLLRQFSELVNHDQGYGEMLVMERDLVERANAARTRGTRPPSFAPYDRLRTTFEKRFRDHVHVLKYVFAVKSPHLVDGMIKRAGTFPIYRFKLDAPFFTALDWDVLASHESIVPGDQALPYVPYLDVVDGYLTCEQFFD